MHKTDLTWLAGLLEGEGSFGARNGVPSLGLGMMDKDVVDKAGELLGMKTYISKTPAGKPFWTLRTSGRYAAFVMSRLRPWMGRRRTVQIDKALSQWSGGMARGPIGASLSATDVSRIREMARCGLNNCEIARRLGKPRGFNSTVSRVVRGITHAD